jgi:hypothetical protein
VETATVPLPGTLLGHADEAVRDEAERPLDVTDDTGEILHGEAHAPSPEVHPLAKFMKIGRCP